MFITDVETAKPKDAGKKTGAIATAIIIHVVLALIFALIVVLPSMRDEPEIVAAIIGPPARQEQQIQKKSVAKQASMTSASAASAMKNLMRANAAAVIAAPEVTKTSTSAVGLGKGDFGGGFGVGGGSGGMAEISAAPGAPMEDGAGGVAFDARAKAIENLSADASVGGGGAAVEYRIPRTITAASDASAERRTRVATIDAKPNFTLVAQPLVDGDVYLRARFVNESPYILLAGRARMYLGSDSIG